MEEIFRYIQPEGGNHKGTSTCHREECGKTTREGKPYCSDHIEDGWYVQEVLAELEKAENEENTLLRGEGRISQDGFFYREAMLLLNRREFTGKGLARRLDISHLAAIRLIALMSEDGYVTTSRTARGDVTVSGLRPSMDRVSGSSPEN